MTTTIREKAGKAVAVTTSHAPHYNKGIAAAAVTVVAWAASLLGVDVPAEVQGALITLAVVVIPNR